MRQQDTAMAIAFKRAERQQRHHSDTAAAGDDWQISLTCQLTCLACNQALYFHRGTIAGRMLSDQHVAERQRIIAEAFATYEPHSMELFHHVGGHINYSERQL